MPCLDLYAPVLSRHLHAKMGRGLASNRDERLGGRVDSRSNHFMCSFGKAVRDGVEGASDLSGDEFQSLFYLVLAALALAVAFRMGGRFVRQRWFGRNRALEIQIVAVARGFKYMPFAEPHDFSGASEFGPEVRALFETHKGDFLGGLVNASRHSLMLRILRRLPLADFVAFHHTGLTLWRALNA